MKPDGDVSSVARLIANPGPDGLTLREALLATNNDPGSYTIRFAAALAGKTITLESELPSLTGGGVTVEGDIDGSGEPDVTLAPTAALKRSGGEGLSGFKINSSRNRLNALALQGFPIGVGFMPAAKPSLPRNRTFADNVVSGLVIRAVREGIVLNFYSPACSLPKPPCPTYNRWLNTTLSDNTIEARQSGIHFDIGDSIGDRIEGLTVTENAVRLGTRANPAEGGAAIQVDQGLNSIRSRISKVVVARNTIEGVGGDGGIVVAAGLQRARANTMDHVRILDNRVHIAKGGPFPRPCIDVWAGGDVWAVKARPVRYPDGNIVRDVQVAGNSLSGDLLAGVTIHAGAGGLGGGSHNRIENVRVERNVIRSSVGEGVYLWIGDIFPFRGVYARGNRVTGVTIDANRITIGNNTPVPGETDRRTARRHRAPGRPPLRPRWGGERRPNHEEPDRDQSRGRQAHRRGRERAWKPRRLCAPRR